MSAKGPAWARPNSALNRTELLKKIDDLYQVTEGSTWDQVRAILLVAGAIIRQEELQPEMRRLHFRNGFNQALSKSAEMMDEVTEPLTGREAALRILKLKPEYFE